MWEQVFSAENKLSNKLNIKYFGGIGEDKENLKKKVKIKILWLLFPFWYDVLEFQYDIIREHIKILMHVSK